MAMISNSVFFMSALLALLDLNLSVDHNHRRSMTEELSNRRRAHLYNTLEEILPLVTFKCKNKIPGYYADPRFKCQVFHYCHKDGSRVTIPCPPSNNGIGSPKNRICLLRTLTTLNCHQNEPYLVLPEDANFLQTKDTTSSVYNGVTDFKLPLVAPRPRFDNEEDHKPTTPLSSGDVLYFPQYVVNATQHTNGGFEKSIESEANPYFVQTVESTTLNLLPARFSRGSARKANGQQETQMTPSFDFKDDGIQILKTVSSKRMFPENSEKLGSPFLDSDSSQLADKILYLLEVYQKSLKDSQGCTSENKTETASMRKATKRSPRKKRMVVKEMTARRPHSIIYAKFPAVEINHGLESWMRYNPIEVEPPQQEEQTIQLSFDPSHIPHDIPTIPIAIKIPKKEKTRKQTNRKKLKPKVVYDSAEIQGYNPDESLYPRPQVSEQQNVLFVLQELPVGEIGPDEPHPTNNQPSNEAIQNSFDDARTQEPNNDQFQLSREVLETQQPTTEIDVGSSVLRPQESIRHQTNENFQQPPPHFNGANNRNQVQNQNFQNGHPQNSVNYLPNFQNGPQQPNFQNGPQQPNFQNGPQQQNAQNVPTNQNFQNGSPNLNFRNGPPNQNQRPQQIQNFPSGNPIPHRPQMQNVQNPTAQAQGMPNDIQNQRPPFQHQSPQIQNLQTVHSSQNQRQQVQNFQNVQVLSSVPASAVSNSEVRGPQFSNPQNLPAVDRQRVAASTRPVSSQAPPQNQNTPDQLPVYNPPPITNFRTTPESQIVPNQVNQNQNLQNRYPALTRQYFSNQPYPNSAEQNAYPQQQFSQAPGPFFFGPPPNFVQGSFSPFGRPFGNLDQFRGAGPARPQGPIQDQRHPQNQIPSGPPHAVIPNQNPQQQRGSINNQQASPQQNQNAPGEHMNKPPGSNSADSFSHLFNRFQSPFFQDFPPLPEFVPPFLRPNVQTFPGAGSLPPQTPVNQNIPSNNARPEDLQQNRQPVSHPRGPPSSIVQGQRGGNIENIRNVQNVHLPDQRRPSNRPQERPRRPQNSIQSSQGPPQHFIDQQGQRVQEHRDLRQNVPVVLERPQQVQPQVNPTPNRLVFDIPPYQVLSRPQHLPPQNEFIKPVRGSSHNPNEFVERPSRPNTNRDAVPQFRPSPDEQPGRRRPNTQNVNQRPSRPDDRYRPPPPSDMPPLPPLPPPIVYTDDDQEIYSPYPRPFLYGVNQDQDIQQDNRGQTTTNPPEFGDKAVVFDDHPPRERKPTRGGGDSESGGRQRNRYSGSNSQRDRPDNSNFEPPNKVRGRPRDIATRDPENQTHKPIDHNQINYVTASEYPDRGRDPSSRDRSRDRQRNNYRPAVPTMETGFQPMTEREPSDYATRAPPSQRLSTRNRAKDPERTQYYDRSTPAPPTTTRKPKPIPPRPTFPSFPTFPPPPRRRATTASPAEEAAETTTESVQAGSRDTTVDPFAHKKKRLNSRPRVASVTESSFDPTPFYDHNRQGSENNFDDATPRSTTRPRTRKRTRTRQKRPRTTTPAPLDSEAQESDTIPGSSQDYTTRSTKKPYTYRRSTTPYTTSTEPVTSTSISIREESADSEEFGNRIKLFGRPRSRKPGKYTPTASATTLSPEEANIDTETKKPGTSTRTRRPYRKRYRTRPTTLEPSDVTEPIARSDEEVDSLEHSDSSNTHTSKTPAVEYATSDAPVTVPYNQVIWSAATSKFKEDAASTTTSVEAGEKEFVTTTMKPSTNIHTLLKFGKPKLKAS